LGIAAAYRCDKSFSSDRLLAAEASRTRQKRNRRILASIGGAILISIVQLDAAVARQ
jgi:hypothetical protein